jgi:glycosyltransferase involved in cell wall biosynthesis
LNKILHVFRSMNYGGAEILIMQLYRILHKRIQFDFILTSDDIGVFDEEIKRLGGRLFRVPNPKNNLIGFNKALKKVIRENGDYLAVHSHTYFFSGIVLKTAYQLNVPCRIAHSHTIVNTNKSLIRKIYQWFMRRYILKNATHLLGCSRNACEMLFGNFCWEDYRVFVFRNGLNTSQFVNSRLTSVRDQFNLDNKTVIVHVGRFSEVKNHARVIDIFKSYLNLDSDAQLLLVGDGPLKEKIKDRVKELQVLSNVHFLGERNDIPDILEISDLFLFPSLFEGLGNVVIEAQFAGVPCVVSNNVPRETDLKLELIRYISLNDNNSVWVKQMIESLKLQKIHPEKRLVALKSAGFDIFDSVKFIEDIYLETIK